MVQSRFFVKGFVIDFWCVLSPNLKKFHVAIRYVTEPSKECEFKYFNYDI